MSDSFNIEFLDDAFKRTRLMVRDRTGLDIDIYPTESDIKRCKKMFPCFYMTIAWDAMSADRRVPYEYIKSSNIPFWNSNIVENRLDNVLRTVVNENNSYIDVPKYA